MTGAAAHPKLREKQERMNSEKQSGFPEYADLKPVTLILGILHYKIPKFMND